jgi:hypothetical protein
MEYNIQKLILENATVYNILLDDHILGHIIENNDGSKYILQSHPTINFSLIAEELGFNGEFNILNENSEDHVKLLKSETSKSANFKVFNFDYLTLDPAES